MFKIVKNLTVLVFIVISIIFMIINPNEVITAVNHAIMLWITRVFPVLFPFYIITSLAVKFGVAHFIGDLIKPFTRLLFKTSAISGFIFFMSLISGNPSSAIIISQLYDDKSLNKTEAQHLLNFCVFANPLFIIGTLGYTYFNNFSIGIIILISHILGNIVIGFLLRFNIKTNIQERFSFKGAYKKMIKQKSRNHITFGETMTSILHTGMSTMFLICGFMIFYNLIIVMFTTSHFIIYSYQYLKPLFNLFKINFNTYQAIFTGFFEMTIGVDKVVKSQFSLRLAITLITMIISFGGLSVHSQIQSLLLKVKLKYYPFFLSRLSQMVFSGVIAYYLFPILYKEKTTSTFLIGNLNLENKSIVLIILIISIITLFITLFNTYKKQLLKTN